MWPAKPLKTNTHIVITGASGFIGSAFVAFFHEKGYTVSALARKPPSNRLAGVNYVHYDMGSIPDTRLFNKETILIHCAYSKTQTTTDTDINSLAARHLLELAAQHTIKRCIFLSSLSADSGSGTYYARQKKQLEALFAQANSTILRPGLVIGNGGLFYQTLTTIRKTRLLPITGGGQQPVYYISIKDLARITEDVILKQRTGTFYALNQPAIPFITFYKTVARSLSIQLRVLPVPIWLLKTAAFAYKVLPVKAKITSDNIKGLQNVPFPDPSILRSSVFDFEFESLEESLRNL